MVVFCGHRGGIAGQRRYFVALRQRFTHQNLPSGASSADDQNLHTSPLRRGGACGLLRLSAPSLPTGVLDRDLAAPALPQLYLTTTLPFMPASLWPMSGQYIS